MLLATATPEELEIIERYLNAIDAVIIENLLDAAPSAEQIAVAENMAAS